MTGLSRPSAFFRAAKTWMPGTSPGMTRRAPYSDIGLSEMSQSLPLKIEMKSVFIGV
jgi:hypothetical protein